MTISKIRKKTSDVEKNSTANYTHYESIYILILKGIYIASGVSILKIYPFYRQQAFCFA